MKRRRAMSFKLGVLAAATLVAFAGFASGASRRLRKEPVFGTSAEDPLLTMRIAALGAGVSPDEARRVTYTAYTTGRDLRRDWRVVWPPGLQNFLVLQGKRKGGLCFQWATELLIRLNALNLQTIELHWAEAFPTTASEHNVIVVTARGQPFEQGIILDNWRYSGRLVWGLVTTDPHYEWRENRGELSRRSRMKSVAAE